MDKGELHPAVVDDSGYRLTSRDLTFLQITRNAFDAWSEGKLPLGFSSNTYDALASGIRKALDDDGVDPGNVDVRLKGSSTRFFSGFHKELPTTPDNIVNAFRELRGRFPELFELDEIADRLGGQWPPPETPLRRPFDSMHRLGIDRVSSDYDLQICSDEIVAKCDAVAVRAGITVTREVTHHDVYNFVRRDLVRSAMPRLTAFATLMSDALGRDVTLAVFESGGPPDHSAEIGDLSAHFRASDWCLLTPRGAEQVAP